MLRRIAPLTNATTAPFTLKSVPDYPATLEVDYPERLSRGLALVKSWLLALPHYLVVGIFAGGSWGGLISVLVCVAGLVLLFTGTIFARGLRLRHRNEPLGLRVVAYAALMTDEYPPFRLDMGGSEADVFRDRAAVAGTAS